MCKSDGVLSFNLRVGAFGTTICNNAIIHLPLAVLFFLLCITAEASGYGFF